ncbi:hypothetical protein MAR_033224 [Mya arenaria]|uniref:Uncharacterized protein n=1 Tax=Mya arenaria TaxID=6604 RepID=A0ABY7G8E4_MYAAR|nr:hypothetical protein MAR_033224 [Mya arenaria]
MEKVRKLEGGMKGESKEGGKNGESKEVGGREGWRIKVKKLGEGRIGRVKKLEGGKNIESKEVEGREEWGELIILLRLNMLSFPLSLCYRIPGKKDDRKRNITLIDI